MSLLFHCDKCGKIVTKEVVFDSNEDPNLNWCVLHYADEVTGEFEYHLCESCKVDFNSWLKDSDYWAKKEGPLLDKEE